MGKSGRPPKLDAVTVASDLAQSRGNVSAVAKKHNVTRGAVQKLVKRTPALQEVLDDAREGMLDEAEGSLYKAMSDGEAWAVCFFLKTQGKSRGYIERQADLPPLDLLLAALPTEVADVVRKALANALQHRGDKGSSSSRVEG